MEKGGEKTLQTGKSERRKWFNFRPALFCFFFLALGILFRAKSFPWYAYIFLALLAVAVLFLSRKTTVVCFSLLTVAFLIGYASYSARLVAFSDLKIYHGEYTMTGTVEKSVQTENGQYLTVGDLTFDGKKSKGTISFFSGAEAQKGEEVIFRCFVQTDKTATPQKVQNFGAYHATNVQDFLVVGRKNDLFSRIRFRIVDRLDEGMDEESAGTAKALLLGDTSGIESGLLKNAREGGIAHLFAVSGLHIGVVYALCRFLTKKFAKKHPVFAYLLTATGVLLYGAVCSFTPSVFRATFTCLFSYAFALLGVKSDGLSRVGGAGCAVLFFSPADLFSAGFLLSFSACIGIFTLSKTIFDALYGVLEKVFRFLFRPRVLYLRPFYKNAASSVSGFLSVCLSAQLFTAPVLVAYFGFFPLAGIFLNCLFVPLVGVGFSFLLAITLLSCVITSGGLLLKIPSLVLSFLSLLFHAVDFSSFTLGAVRFPCLSAVLFYGAVIVCSDKCNLKKRERIWLFVALALGWVIVEFL